MVHIKNITPLFYNALTVILTILIFFTPLSVADENSTELLKKINKKYLSSSDIKIKFTHETIFTELEEKSSGNGTLYIKTPGKMLWHYIEPLEQKIFVNGNLVTLYSPNLEQAVLSNLNANLSSQIPLKLLLGSVLLTEEFYIETITVTDKHIFTLTPKPGKLNQIEKLEITEENLTITALVIYLKNENLSVFTFSEFKWNSGLENDLFNFIPEDNTEIIDYQAN